MVVSEGFYYGRKITFTCSPCQRAKARCAPQADPILPVRASYVEVGSLKDGVGVVREQVAVLRPDVNRLHRFRQTTSTVLDERTETSRPAVGITGRPRVRSAQVLGPGGSAMHAAVYNSLDDYLADGADVVEAALKAWRVRQPSPPHA